MSRHACRCPAAAGRSGVICNLGHPLCLALLHLAVPRLPDPIDLVGAAILDMLGDEVVPPVVTPPRRPA